MRKINVARVKEFIYNNILFLTFVLTSLINSFLLRAFTVKNFFSIAPILADITIILLIGTLGYVIKSPKRRFAYYMPWCVLFTFLCLANSIYYTNYRSFISISLISTASQLGGVVDAVTESILEIKDLVFLWAIIAMIAVFVVLVKRQDYFDKMLKNQKRKKAVIGTLATAGVCLVLFSVNLTGTDLSRLAKQWNREYVLSRFGLFTYQISDTVSSVMAKLNVLFGYEENREIFVDFYEEKIENEIDSKTEVNAYTGIFEGKNVIAIHAESIQQFCLETSFNGEELTPNLNKLASEGIYFSNFYAQESVGTSSDTEFTFSTSLMPASSGTVAINYWDRDYVTTQKLFKDKGYYVFSMHGNNGSYWNRLNFHSSLGYDRFFNYDVDFEIDESIGLGLSDKSFFDQSVEKIKKIHDNYEKFYATMIMLTNHTPFTDIEPISDYSVTFDYMEYDENTGRYNLVSAPFLEGTKLGSYLKSVHYADEAIGQLVSDLDEQGILDNTVLVIYGDHDAKIKEDFYELYYNYNPFTGETLSKHDEGYIPVDDYAYKLNRKVPFIIWSKEKEYQPVEVDTVMGMYDCQPTLSNMFGLERNIYALGTDIFSLEEGEENVVTFPNGSFLTDTVYYNSQKDAYFDVSGYENVAVNASCNAQFKDFLPEEIRSDEYSDYKQYVSEEYNEEAFEQRVDNGAVDKEYVAENSTLAEERITISNAIIYYDMIRRVKEEGSLEAIEEKLASMTTTVPVITQPPEQSSKPLTTTTTAPKTSPTALTTSKKEPVETKKATVTTVIKD